MIVLPVHRGRDAVRMSASAAPAVLPAADESMSERLSPVSSTSRTPFDLISDVLSRLSPLSSSDWDWSPVFAIAPARSPASGGPLATSREQVQTIMQTKEGRTTRKVELEQLCRQALQHASAQPAESESSQRLLHFVQRVLDPTQVHQWMKEVHTQTYPLDHESLPPVAAVAATLASVYEVIADALMQHAGQLNEKTVHPVVNKLVKSMTESLQSYVHPNSQGCVLACCYTHPRLKKLAGDLNKQSFASAGEFAAFSLAAVALEGAAMMRIIVEKRLAARGPKDFDLFRDSVPACLRVQPPVMSLESAVLILQRLVGSVQAMNARILTQYVEIFYPTWISLPATALVLERLNVAAKSTTSNPSSTAISSADSAAASSSLTLAVSFSVIGSPAAALTLSQRLTLFSSCLQLLCAFVPQLEHQNALSGVEHQPLPSRINAKPFRRHIEAGSESSSSSQPQPSSSPLQLHFHAQPWASRVREGVTQFGIFGNQEKYLLKYTAVVKLSLLQLMHSMAVETSDLNSIRYSSAPSGSSNGSPHTTAVAIASCLWKDLECDAEVAAVAEYIKLLSAVLPTPPAGSVVPQPTPRGTSARETLDRLLREDTTVDVDALLQLTTASGEDEARLICVFMQNALLRWPNMDETLIRGMQEFILKHLPLLIETEVVNLPADREVESTELECAASATPFPRAASSNTSSPLPSAFESDSLHLCDNILQDGLYTVLNRLVQYFPEYAPQSQNSRAAAINTGTDVNDEDVSIKAESTLELQIDFAGASSLPSWLPAVRYTGVDDLDPLARQYRGFGTSTTDRTADFHPSQAAARENDPRRLFTGALRSTIRTMKLHSQFLLDQMREHVRRVHRCERSVETSRQIDPALKAEKREERSEMKQRMKLRGKACELPTVIAKAIRKQEERALSRELQSGEVDDVEMKNSEESTVEAGQSSTDRESSVSPLPPTHLARKKSSSHHPMISSDIHLTSLQLLRDFSLTTFTSSLLLDLIIPRDDHDCVLSEDDVSDENPSDVEEADVARQGATSSMFNPRWYAMLLLYPDSERIETPSLVSVREIISTLLRVIDACMEAVGSEARLLESLLTCRFTLPAPSQSSVAATPEPLADLFLSSLPSLHALHSSVVLLTDLHALYPEDSEEAWNRMVVEFEAACGAITQLMRQHNLSDQRESATEDVVVEEIIGQLTLIRTLISPHHAAALEHLKEKRAELKRKRVHVREADAEPTDVLYSSLLPSDKRRRTHLSSTRVRSSPSYTHPVLDAFSSRDAELSDDPENDREDFRELEAFLAQDPCSICQRETEEDGENGAITVQCCRTCHKPVCLECAPLELERKKFRCANCCVRRQQRTPA